MALFWQSHHSKSGGYRLGSVLLIALTSFQAWTLGGDGSIFPTDPGREFMATGRIDTNGNGPDPGDPPLIQEFGPSPNPVTGNIGFLPVTPWGSIVIEEGPNSFLPGFSVGRAFQKGSAPTILQRLTGAFNSQGRFQGFEFSQDKVATLASPPTSRITGRLALIDADNNGNCEGFNLEFDGETIGENDPPAFSISIDFVFVDTEGDGVTDAFTIPWILSNLTALGAGLFDDKPELSPIYLPLTDPFGDGSRTIALDLDQNGQADFRIPLVANIGPSATPLNPQYFAQVGDGEAGVAAARKLQMKHGTGPSAEPIGQAPGISSEFILLNPDTAMDATATVALKGDDGGALAGIDLDDQILPEGTLEVMVPASGMRILRTDGLGPLTAGSATVLADKRLTSVVVFNSTVGAAGVGSSASAPTVIAPMLRDSTINTGIALQNSGMDEAMLRLFLFGADGKQQAFARLALAGMGHRALFVDEILWTAQFGDLDFSDFQGIVKVIADTGSVAATVIQTRQNEFVTLPVAIPTSVGSLELNFAQFGDGQVDGLDLDSTIILLGLQQQLGIDTQATIAIKNDDGDPVTDVQLNGQDLPDGTLDITVPGNGMVVLRTDGQGPLRVGSVTVTSDKQLAGVIVFAGTTGAAGVGVSERLPGFRAPMIKNATTSTGIAVQNPEMGQLTLQIELRNSEGQLLSTATLVLPSMGHRALFVDEIPWTPETGVVLDFSDFQGVLKATTSGGTVAATVIQTRAGNLFVTMPVGRCPI